MCTRTDGPISNNVFLNCYSQDGHLSPEPHQGWSSAIAYDNVYSDSTFKLHGDLSDHGQSSANNILWNCVSESYRYWEPEIWLNSPASGLGTNWVVGAIINGVHTDPAVENHDHFGNDGFVEATGTSIRLIFALNSPLNGPLFLGIAASGGF